MEWIPAKTLITRTKDRSWFGTRYNMNIYKGCCHGCIYCDSRSACYQIDHFDKVRAKENALEIMRKQLKGRCGKGVIGTGAMSDPYNPFEMQEQLTRGALELIHTYRFGIFMITKSNLVERDIDLLTKINKHSPVNIGLTITTSDDCMSQLVEPHVCPSSMRFDALKKLSEAGIFCGILMMPILPFIEDTEENILEIVRLAAKNGANYIYPSMGMTMREGQRTYFYQALEEHFPGVKAKYEKCFDHRYHCSSPKAEKLWGAFVNACKQYGLLYKMSDIIKVYQSGFWQEEQLSLF